jgi:tRNA-modifying protein YgfZ
MRTLPLHQLHHRHAHSFVTTCGWELPLEYTTSETEFNAALHGVALMDLSWYGRIRISGKDATDLMHRLSSNDLQNVPQGNVIDTMFLTEKGRLIDVVTLVPEEGGWLMITSPGREESLMKWIGRYTFSEDVTMHDITNESVLFFLVGPGAPEFCRTKLGMDIPPRSVLSVNVGTSAAWAIRVVTARWRGTLFFGNASEGESLWQSLRERDAALTPLGFRSFDAIRIRHSWPFPGKEIDEAYNPYDIGMTGAISTTKGCYIGQEVVARLDTYQKVRRGPRGLRLSGPVSQQRAVLSLEGEQVGWVTSSMDAPLDRRILGLGVIQTNVPAGAELSIANSAQTAVVTTMPDES